MKFLGFKILPKELKGLTEEELWEKILGNGYAQPKCPKCGATLVLTRVNMEASLSCYPGYPKGLRIRLSFLCECGAEAEVEATHLVIKTQGFACENGILTRKSIKGSKRK